VEIKLKCPNCGHVFEPDEDEDKKKTLFFPGVPLVDKEEI